jgi:hypothetical protein
MKLFKNKYQIRIEDKIKMLSLELNLTTDLKLRMKVGSNYTSTDYCRLVLKESDLNDKINLLKSLL